MPNKISRKKKYKPQYKVINSKIQLKYSQHPRDLNYDRNVEAKIFIVSTLFKPIFQNILKYVDLNRIIRILFFLLNAKMKKKTKIYSNHFKYACLRIYVINIPSSKRIIFEHIAALLIKFKFSSLDIFYDKVVHAKGFEFIYRIGKPQTLFSKYIPKNIYHLSTCTAYTICVQN